MAAIYGLLKKLRVNTAEFDDGFLYGPLEGATVWNFMTTLFHDSKKQCSASSARFVSVFVSSLNHLNSLGRRCLIFLSKRRRIYSFGIVCKNQLGWFEWQFVPQVRERKRVAFTKFRELKLLLISYPS